jgi:hypothetical protein
MNYKNNTEFNINVGFSVTHKNIKDAVEQTNCQQQSKTAPQQHTKSEPLVFLFIH